MLCKSHRSGHRSMLVNCAAREVNSGILTSLSSALFFPWTTKQKEMFQLGEHVVEMVGEERNPSLWKPMELQFCQRESVLSALIRRGKAQERREHEERRERGSGNGLGLIQMSQVERTEPWTEVFCLSWAKHRADYEAGRCRGLSAFLGQQESESYAERCQSVPPNESWRSQERQYRGRGVEGQWLENALLSKPCISKRKDQW